MEKSTAALLKQAREQQGLTQSQLAGILEVETQTISSWERGKRFPSVAFRAHLAQALGKSPEELGFLPLPPQPHEDPAALIVLKGEAAEASPGERGPLLPNRQHDEELLPANTLRDEQLQSMAGRMRYRITDILDRTLLHTTIILPQFREQPEAVERSWDMAVPTANLLPHTLPLGTSMLTMYEHAGGELLILGEPGSGKTTQLLQLARDLLARIESGEQHMLPVVFDLSFWTTKHARFEDWLISELSTKYQVPQKIGRQWIAADKIQLLLDGLDQIALSHRRACVLAINRYRRLHGLVPIVICSRSAAYFAQPVPLLLHRAFIIEPLAAQHITAYLQQIGGDRANALQDDPQLQALLTTPLLLTQLAQTDDMASDDLLSADNVTDMRQHLIKRAIDSLLQHRNPSQHYSAQETMRYLIWLAGHMHTHHQIEFSLAHLQPDWLDEGRAQARYRHIVMRIIFGLGVMLNTAALGYFLATCVTTPAGLFSWLRGKGPGNALFGWMAPGIGSGLHAGGSLGLLICLTDVLLILFTSCTRRPPFSPASLRDGIIRGLWSALLFGTITALASGLIFCLAGGVANGVAHGIGTGLFAGILAGLVGGLGSLCTPGARECQPFPLRTLLDHLVDFVLFAGCGALGVSSVYALLVRALDTRVWLYGLIVGLACGLFHGLGNGPKQLLPDLGRHIRPANTASWSWSHVRHRLAPTMGKGLLTGLATSIIMLILLGSISGLFYGETYGWRYGLVYGLMLGLVGTIAAFLMGIIQSGWSCSVPSEEPEKHSPQDIPPSSATAGVLVWCLFGLLGGIVSGLLSGFCLWIATVPGWATLFWGLALVYSVLFTFRLWAAYDGYAWVERVVLRCYLWHRRAIPRKYAAFLEYAVDCALLHKVRGSYRFAHPLLFDYFVHLYEEEAMS